GRKAFWGGRWAGRHGGFDPFAARAQRRAQPAFGRRAPVRRGQRLDGKRRQSVRTDLPTRAQGGAHAMKISIFGLGYVGAVSLACLSRDGHFVTGVDIDKAKLDLIRAGKTPV